MHRIKEQLEDTMRKGREEKIIMNDKMRTLLDRNQDLEIKVGSFYSGK